MIFELYIDTAFFRAKPVFRRKKDFGPPDAPYPLRRSFYFNWLWVTIEIFI